jgi:hypothetical protein
MTPDQEMDSRRQERMAQYRFLGKIFVWSGWAVAVVALILGGRIIDRLAAKVKEGEKARAQTGSPAQTPWEALTSATAFISLRGAEGNEPAEGKIFLGTNNRRAILVAKGLAPLAAGQTYKVWLIKTGEPVAAGVLSVDETGGGFVEIHQEEPLKNFQAATITLEPGKETAAPSGPIVMAGTF